MQMAALTEAMLGQSVSVAGWAGRLRVAAPSLAFVPLRDSSGASVQLALLQSVPQPLPPESFIRATGVVARKAGGGVELRVSDWSLLNAAAALPIQRRHIGSLAEELRLRHRHLDLRWNAALRRNLAVRHRALLNTRALLDSLGFIEVETPILCNSSPEGASEFLVPSLVDGRQYALAQSPQQFKQLLVAGGVDRYFQVARCFRREAQRSDRQVEFTQLDLEVAGAEEGDVMRLAESAVREFCRAAGVELPQAVPVLTYQEAMDRYGSDKPDTRIPLTIRQMPSPDACWKVDCLVVPALGRDAVQRFLSQDRDFSPEHVEVSAASALALGGAGAAPSDLAVCHRRPSRLHVGSTLLGRLRLFAGAACPPAKTLHALWVTRFPLFRQEAGRLVSTHHPFTAPVGPLHGRDPLAIDAHHYDLVVNGCEVAGGSLRIHSSRDQLHVLEQILRLSPAQVGAFQHLLDALASGCPPHGGIAIGVDRLLAIVCGAPSIRDVIAFPKTGDGRDLCVHSPS